MVNRETTTILRFASCPSPRRRGCNPHQRCASQIIAPSCGRGWSTSTGSCCHRDPYPGRRWQTFRPGDLSHLILLTAFDPRSQLYWWSTLGSANGASLEAERDRFLGSHKFAIGDSKLVSFMVVDRFLWVRSCNQRSPDQEGGYQQAFIKFREMHTQLLTGTKRIDMFTALGGDFLNDTPAKMMDIEIESVAWVDNGWNLEVRARNNDRRGSIFLDPDFELAIGPVRP